MGMDGHTVHTSFTRAWQRRRRVCRVVDGRHFHGWALAFFPLGKEGLEATVGDGVEFHREKQNNPLRSNLFEQLLTVLDLNWFLRTRLGIGAVSLKSTKKGAILKCTYVPH
eukprot:CCRYP_012289-RA/>CCRYP_012289-RA protein AED:0.42 eAED:0.45 QI:0/0/0/1/0/0/3/0/110